jgi:hypothetical protein
VNLAHLTTAEDGGSRFSEIQIPVNNTGSVPSGIRRSETLQAEAWAVMERPEGLQTRAPGPVCHRDVRTRGIRDNRRSETQLERRRDVLH